MRTVQIHSWVSVSIMHKESYDQPSRYLAGFGRLNGPSMLALFRNMSGFFGKIGENRETRTVVLGMELTTAHIDGNILLNLYDKY